MVHFIDLEGYFQMKKRSQFLQNYSHPFYKNSILLVFGYAIMALLGFLYWTFAARIYSPEQVGTASTLISLVSIITNFSVLGFNISLIGYISKSQKKQNAVTTAILLSSLVAFLLTILFLSLSSFFPFLSFLMGIGIWNTIGIIIASVAGTIFLINEALFISSRKSASVVLRNSLWSLFKIFALFLLLAFGFWGIFFSWYLSLVLVLIPSLFFSGISLKWVFNFDSIKKILSFSLWNHLSNLFLLLPGLLFPAIILSFLAPASAAYFYIPWMIASLLFLIPQSLGKIFLTEQTHSPGEFHFYKVLKFNYSLLLLGLIPLLFLSKWILSLFGADYAIEGFLPLLILLLSSLFFSYISLFSSELNVKGEAKTVALISFGLFFLSLFFTFLFIKYGLLGISFSWLFANIIISFYLFFKTFSRSFTSHGTVTLSKR